MMCKYCGCKLVKVMVSPFEQAGWYHCYGCNASGPIWMLKK